MSDEQMKRLAAIEDRQAIQDLRHTYWFSIIDKDVDTMINCYAENSHSEFGFGFVVDGKEQLTAFYKKQLENEDLIIQVPRGANGLVELVDETNARGRWVVAVAVIKKSQNHGVRSTVEYYEEYVKVGGKWKISLQRNKYLHWETMDLRTGP